MLDRERHEPAGGGEPALPGRLSALLRDLARVPEAELGSGWSRALEPGTVLGRFELLREVGRGGFGVVYEARDRDLGRNVAFKAIRAGACDPARDERLLREAEAAARLSHPNIVTLFDVGRSDQGPYLVFEFLRGRTLAERLRAERLSTAEALRIALEVAKAVAHAHASGVVHRDLTPGNVFLCDDGLVKVLDFGMAHAFGRPRLEGGTPGYMAPEQRRGEPEDERTDVFALGVILYLLLSRQHPFRRGDEYAPPAVLDVPGAPGLGDRIASMLAEDATQRPRNGGEVVAILAPLVRELDAPPHWKAAAHGRRRRVLAVAAAAGLAAGLGAAELALRSRTRAVAAVQPASAAAAVLTPSIAVLPFADLSPKRDHEYFSDGLADEIIGALAQVEGLRVAGRASSFYFKGKDAALADVGRELNVSAVLEGTVRRAGSRVVVAAEIVNVADGRRIWSQTFDRELKDVFGVQGEIAGAVVASLDVRSPSGKPPSVAPLATKDPEAYRQYLLGRHHYRRFSAESLPLAVKAFERALELDPGYAPAWAGLAFPAYFVALDEKTLPAVDRGRRRALAAAQRAVELAPDLADGLSARGVLRATLDYDWAGAKADLERAVAANGSDGDTRRRHATVLANLGHLREAIAEARSATEIDPLGGSWGKLGLELQAAGQLAEAEAAFRRGLEIWPDNVQSRLGLGRNLLLAGKPKEALELYERCPGESDRLWGRAAAEHALGNAAASTAALEKFAARDGHTGAFAVAQLHAWRGEKDEAFRWLERAFVQRDGDMLAFRTDPFLASLHGDPRFQSLLRRMNLPAE